MIAAHRDFYRRCHNLEIRRHSFANEVNNDPDIGNPDPDRRLCFDRLRGRPDRHAAPYGHAGAPSSDCPDARVAGGVNRCRAAHAYGGDAGCNYSHSNPGTDIGAGYNRSYADAAAHAGAYCRAGTDRAPTPAPTSPPAPTPTRVYRPPTLTPVPTATTAPTPASNHSLTPANSIKFVRQVEADTTVDASNNAFVTGQSTTHCRVVESGRYYTTDGDIAIEYDYSPIWNTDGVGVSRLREYFPNNQWQTGSSAVTQLYINALSQIGDICNGLDTKRQ